MSTLSLETGPVHVVFDSSTRSGSGSVNAPLARWPGSETDRVASPAVEMTLAFDVAVYSFATPGVNAPNEAGAPSVRLSVAGTVPPTGAVGASTSLMSAWLTSKNTLPIASTLIRALAALTD